MKTLLSWAVLVAACVAMFTPSRAHAQVEVSFDYFYDALEPYGTWVEVEGYGPCWSPGNVDADWAPYTDGGWVYTDAGWTWLGDEPFSSIVDHYGRWIMAGSLGWCWVPGYEWAPAWVSWRDSDDYVGWAPLPPEVTWDPEIGVGIWVDEVYGIGPSFYVFCHHRDFGERHLRTVIMARSWNTAILVKTHNITHIAFNRALRGICAGGLDLGRARRFSSSPIAALHLECRSDYDFHGDHFHALLPGGLVTGTSLVVVAPTILPMPANHIVRPATQKVIARAQINRGWIGKGAGGNLDFVRQQIHAEAQGHTPKSDPVRPVMVRDPQFVLQKNSGPILYQPQPANIPANAGAPGATGQALTAQPGATQRAEAPDQQITRARPQEAEAMGRNQGLQAQQNRELAVRQENEAALVRQQQAAEARRERELVMRQQGAEAMARRQAQEQEQRRSEMQLEQRRQDQARTEAQQRAAAEISREHAHRMDLQRRPSEPAVQVGIGKPRDEEDRKKKK